jgi:hypothetical protein
MSLSPDTSVLKASHRFTSESTIAVFGFATLGYNQVLRNSRSVMGRLMKSLRESALSKQAVQMPISVLALADTLGLRAPLSLLDILTSLVPEKRTFRFPLSAASVEGWCELSVASDGSAAWSGHLHESGAPTRKCAVILVVRGVVPLVINQQLFGNYDLVVKHLGHVHGTFGIGSRDDDWDQRGVDTEVKANWNLLRTATADAVLGVNTGATEIVEDVFGSFPGLITGAYHLITL